MNVTHSAGVLKKILVEGNVYILQVAHNIAEAVHEDIEKNFPKVKHIMVHVNPGN